MSETKFNVHDAITAKIIAQLETAGGWSKSWQSIGTGNKRPANASTKNPYNGINVFALWFEAQDKSYSSHEWATYKQWGELGCQVRKGEKGSVIVFYSQVKVKEKADDGSVTEKTLPMARASWVFNADQVDGYQRPDMPELSDHARDKAVEAFIAKTGAKITEQGNRAFYRVDTDEIYTPALGQFNSTEAYYATLLHELTHWTRHSSRLDRDMGRKAWGDAGYAMEELVAELGAAMLCADLGIRSEPREDHASYIKHWLEVLKSDNKAIFTAASKASAAVQYLAGLQAEQQIAA